MCGIFQAEDFTGCGREGVNDNCSTVLRLHGWMSVVVNLDDDEVMLNVLRRQLTN